MGKTKSNLLLYGLIFGGLIGAGVAVYFGTKAVINSNKKKKERKHKFYEGIDDIFDESARDVAVADTKNSSEDDKEVVDELFSRSK